MSPTFHAIIAETLAKLVDHDEKHGNGVAQFLIELKI